MNCFLSLNTPDGKIKTNLIPFSESGTFENEFFSVSMETKTIDNCTVSKFILKGNGKAYLSVDSFFDEGEIYTFSGKKDKKEVYRQSPHNPDMWVINAPKEAVPMVACYNNSVYEIIFSDNPASCNNYTTQEIDPENKTFSVCSGDGGQVYSGELEFFEYYHEINENNPHIFTVVKFVSEAKDIISMRKDVFYAIDKVFGNFTDKFHAICFSSNYMHYRVNEKGSSKYWIVPGIEYCNTQYPRDAFWQSMILPEEMSNQCYDGLYKGRYRYAENSLIFILWSYRVFLSGGKYDEERMADALDYIKDHVVDNCYITGVSTNLAFRSWYDICAYENDDCITYCQGLFAVALMALDKMGIPHPYNLKKAIKNYNDLFSEENGIFPMSRKKTDMVSLDATIGDVLAYIYFDKKILDPEKVKRHYETSFKASRTDLGSKVTCKLSGEFCTLKDYSAYGFVYTELATHTPGYYSWGGSYYIYEMLFHIGGFIHNAENAEDNLIWRGGIDFKLGGTYFEHINTVTGDANKANQGWNCCIYYLWNELIKKGIATDKFFKEMEKLL